MAKNWQETTIADDVIKSLLNKNLMGVAERLSEAGKAIANAQAAVSFRDGRHSRDKEVDEAYKKGHVDGTAEATQRCIEHPLSDRVLPQELVEAEQRGIRKVVEDFRTVLDAPERFRLEMFYDVLGKYPIPKEEKGVEK